jgi:tRNA threonylcarbamoyladenosine biosynthesis protein TsaE
MMTLPSSSQPNIKHTLTVEVQTLASLALFCQWLCDTSSETSLVGEVWALDGDLGAGKTKLVQTLCQTLGIEETVSSPTFVLLNEYTTGDFPIVHGDFYRLGENQSGDNQAGENKADGLMQELTPSLEQGSGMILMEWASLSQAYQEWVTLWIHIAYGDTPTSRVITLTSNTPAWKSRFLKRLSND